MMKVVPSAAEEEASPTPSAGRRGWRRLAEAVDAGEIDLEKRREGLERLKRMNQIAGGDNEDTEENDLKLSAEFHKFVCSLALYVVFLLLFCFTTLRDRVEGDAYRLRAQHIDMISDYRDEAGFAFNIHEIGSADEIWAYIGGHLSEELYTTGNASDRMDFSHDDHIQGAGKRFGPVRLRAVRVKRDSCSMSGAATAVEYPDCYPSYEWNGDTEDKDCIKGNGRVCLFEYTEQTAPDKEQYWASQVMGFNTQYPGNGGFILDLPADQEERDEAIEGAKEAGFISFSTRAVFADYSIYFPASNYFIAVRVVWEFSANGGVYTTLDAEVFRAGGISAMPLNVIIADVLLFVILAYYILAEVKEMFLSCTCRIGSAAFPGYFTDADGGVDGWNILDLINYFFFTVTYLLRAQEYQIREAMNTAEAVYSGNGPDNTAFHNVHYLGYYVAIISYVST
jgi:hypothetical protein